MRRLRKLLIALIGAVSLYFVTLFALGFALRGTVESRLKEQIGEALKAEVVDVGDLELDLLRGQVELRDLQIRRSGPGTVRIDVEAIDVDIARYGAVLWNRDANRVLVRGADIDLSAVGAVTLRRGEVRPVEIGELVVEDCTIAVSPTLLLPRLGRAELQVHSARARGAQVTDSISWLFGIEALDADLRAPGDVSVGVTYGDEMLAVRGSFLGSDPIEVPFSFPEISMETLEFKKLAVLTRSLIRALAPELAKRKVSNVAGDLIDLIRD
jgi:hypothetical protein